MSEWCQLPREGTCEWCGYTCAVEEHHIAQGCDRGQALDNPACIIWLCRPCHTTIQGIRDTRLIGLAILKCRRPFDYSLAEFYRVTRRRWPDERDVNLWVSRLCLTEVH